MKDERSMGDSEKEEEAKSAALGGESGDAGTAGKVVSADCLRALCEEISHGKEVFEPGAEKLVADLAEEFVEKLLAKSCALAKHRGASKLEANDIAYVLERDHDIALQTGKGQESVRVQKRLKRDLKNYTKRLQNIQKQMKKGLAHKDKPGDDGKDS